MNYQANIPLIERLSAELRDMLGDDWDAETFWDSLDGETDAGALLDHLIAAEREAQALSDAAKAQADALTKRAARFKFQCGAHRKAMLAILDATGERKAVRAGATVSKTKGRMGVVITDPDAIPTQLCKTTVTPDRAAIKAQLEAGATVPGAALERGADSLSVRAV